MVRIFLTHKVKDFYQWKEGYDADRERQQAAALNTGGYSNSTDDRNSFLIVWDRLDQIAEQKKSAKKWQRRLLDEYSSELHEI